MLRFILLFLFVLILGCEGKAQRKGNANYPASKTEAQWKKLLSPEEFYVLRKKGTEPAFSSKLNEMNEPGNFICAACGQPLYQTVNKFDSGTGWPSFDRPLENANLKYSPALSAQYPSEVLCGNCGGHLGHVFNDGPIETTGKRHCINGDALDFIADKSEN